MTSVELVEKLSFECSDNAQTSMSRYACAAGIEHSRPAERHGPQARTTQARKPWSDRGQAAALLMYTPASEDPDERE